MSVELEAAIDALRMEIGALRKTLTKLDLLSGSSGPYSRSNPDGVEQMLNNVTKNLDALRRSPALRLANHHEILNIDMSKARSQELIWDCKKGWKGYPATKYTYITTAVAFTFAINAVGNGFSSYNELITIEHEIIERIYMTNSAGSGTAKIRLSGWLPPQKKPRAKKVKA